MAWIPSVAAACAFGGPSESISPRTTYPDTLWCRPVNAGYRRRLPSSSSHRAVGRGTIRLCSIGALETGQDFGSRARQGASGPAFGKQVTVRPRTTDRYGRSVAEVILPERHSLNRELVRQGLA